MFNRILNAFKKVKQEEEYELSRKGALVFLKQTMNTEDIYYDVFSDCFVGHSFFIPCEDLNAGHPAVKDIGAVAYIAMMHRMDFIKDGKQKLELKGVL